jgi:hypothetical protein
MKRNETHDLVIAKYASAGWTAVLAPKGSLNDVIAHNGAKLHFVYIDVGKVDSDGLVKNTFIQNAFSNGAVPVYAHIADKKVTLCDINLNSRIIVGKKRTPKSAPLEVKGTKPNQVNRTNETKGKN